MTGIYTIDKCEGVRGKNILYTATSNALSAAAGKRSAAAEEALGGGEGNEGGVMRKRGARVPPTRNRLVFRSPEWSPRIQVHRNSSLLHLAFDN